MGWAELTKQRAQKAAATKTTTPSVTKPSAIDKPGGYVPPKTTTIQPKTVQPTDNETLNYYQNKLNYLDGNLTKDQADYNTGYRNNYGVNETDPTRADLVFKIDQLKNKISNPANTVENTYGEMFNPKLMQENYLANEKAALDAKYNTQTQALASKLQSILSSYDTQRANVIPRYEQSIKALKQEENDDAYALRENLNRMPGTVAQGLQADAVNKIKIAMNNKRGDLEIARDAELSRLSTEQGNAEREILDMIAALDSARGTESGALNSKAYSFMLDKYPSLLNNATSIQNTIADNKRQEEKATQEKLMEQVKTISQYSNDFDAEIQRRKAINPNDPLIPYLNMAREQKIQAQAESTAKAQQELQKYYMDLFKQTGEVTSNEMAAYLGLPLGYKDMDYRKSQYDLGKPYYKPSSSSDKPTATEEKNQSFSEDYSILKSKSVPEAINILTNKKADLIATYGVSGYKQLWDTALADAIRAGQAQTYSNYFQESLY